MFGFIRRQLLPFSVASTFLYILISNKGIAVANPLSDIPKNVPWHISALSVTFDSKKKLYIAEGEVVLTGGKTRLEADYVEFSNKTKDAFARGNVILISGEDSISCNAMDINLETETGTINKGVIFIQKNNFYISGENIRKTGKFSYSADKGSITSCPGDSPDWKITGNKIKATIEGYGTATNTVLWAKNIPAIYSPFLIFPVQTKRQTGLLIPSVSSSERKGLQFEQPLFIAISRNTDATLYTNYMSDRGTKIGAEYRYILDNKTKGSMFADYLEDEKTDDGTNQTRDYSFNSTLQRTNANRYWFRMKHNQDLAKGFTAKLDIDVVSDEDYLLEFRDGFTGYDETKAYFEEEFGRSLDEYNDNTRKNWLNISKSWSTYSFSADALWFDNVSARRHDTADTTLQTLPVIQFDASKQQIGSSGFFYSLNTEFSSFHRQDTTATRIKGQRTDIYPRLYLPLKLARSFNFEPFVGARQTTWYTNGSESDNADFDGFQTRQMYDIGATLSTKLTRIFNPGNDYADKIKHEIKPGLDYFYIPDIEQDDLPSYTSIDRILEKNLITFSVTNNIVARKSKFTPKGAQVSTYRDLAYIKLYQSYDLNKEKNNEPEPFSDIALEAELYPVDLFSLDLELLVSPYDRHVNKLNIGNTIKDNRGDSLKTEYRYESSISESLYSRLDVSLTNKLAAFCSIEKNLKDKKTVEKKAGFFFTKSCWAFNLYFSESADDKSITFLIKLNGIGEFGTND